MSRKALISLTLAAVAYEFMAPDGELLSHAFDELLEQHPVLTWTATLVLAGHLLNALPAWLDPFAHSDSFSIHAWRRHG